MASARPLETDTAFRPESLPPSSAPTPPWAWILPYQPPQLLPVFWLSEWPLTLLDCCLYLQPSNQSPSYAIPFSVFEKPSRIFGVSVVRLVSLSKHEMQCLFAEPPVLCDGVPEWRRLDVPHTALREVWVPQSTVSAHIWLLTLLTTSAHSLVLSCCCCFLATTARIWLVTLLTTSAHGLVWCFLATTAHIWTLLTTSVHIWHFSDPISDTSVWSILTTA